MRNRFLSSLIASSLALSPALRADTEGSHEYTEELTYSEEPTSSTEMAVEPSSIDEESPGTEVGKASNDRKKASKRRQMRNIGIAVGAVIVAVIAMILVSTNNGHKS